MSNTWVCPSCRAVLRKDVFADTDTLLIGYAKCGRCGAKFDESDVEAGRYDNAPTGRAGGGCFVATVCHGRADHPTVATLRAFRDEILIDVAPTLVLAYQRWGPRIAAVVDRAAWFKPVARVLLRVIAGTIRLLRR